MRVKIITSDDAKVMEDKVNSACIDLEREGRTVVDIQFDIDGGTGIAYIKYHW